MQSPRFYDITPTQLYGAAADFAIRESEPLAHDFAAYIVDAHLERDEDTGAYQVWADLNLRRCYDYWRSKVRGS